MFTSLVEEANFGYAGPADCRRRQLQCVWLLGLDGFGAACRRQAGRSCSSTAWATVAPCAGLPYPWRTAPTLPKGSYKTSHARGGGGRVLGWSCPHPRRRMGARTFLHALRRSPSPVSHRCRGGRCRQC
jgi:hypothetical protein